LRRSRYSPSGIVSRSSDSKYCPSQNGVRLLGPKVQVGPCIPAAMQLQKAEVGPTFGPTWRLSHFVAGLDGDDLVADGLLPVPRGPALGRGPVSGHVLDLG
jgi:hypothetical protein